jgi:glycosyltransferase involved in cell wall biosynthesis
LPDNPFFSVVIPIYNKGPHIHRSVRSVLNQTFGDFELLLINDASTDNSLEEMKKFTDLRIRIFHRDQPGPGGYAARNLGISEAQSGWIAFLDADDEWYPEHLEKMYNLSELFPDIYFMGCGWTSKIDRESYIDNYFKQNRVNGSHVLDAKTYLAKCLHNLIPVRTSVACIKVASPIAYNLFPAEKKASRGGDLYAWLKMVCHHKKMAWSAHVGAVYYLDSVNMVTKIAPSSYYLMGRDIYKKLSLGLDREEQKLLKSYLNIMLQYSWIGNIKRGNPNFRLLPKIYWGGYLPNVLKIVILSLIPPVFLKAMILLRMWLKNNAL